MARHRFLSLVCLALPLCLTACGSTVSLGSSSAGLASGASLGLGLDSPGGISTPGSGTGAPISTNPTAAPEATGSTPANGADGSSSGAIGGGSTSGLPSSHARGVTPTTLTVGVAVASGSAALASAFGISGAGSVPPQSIVKALVNDVNKSGGILGRKLAVYGHYYDASAAIANPSQAVGQICADFRDDHKVFAVFADVDLPDLRKCLAVMGSPLIVLGPGSAPLPAAAYTENGGNFLFGPSAITTDRLAQLFIPSLLDRKFTEPWDIVNGGPGKTPAKLGLIHVDTPDQNALYASYIKELAKHGLKFADTVTYTQDAAQALAATQSAVLRFRSAGITHVFGASAFFLQDAQNQHYHPRYAYLPGLGDLGVQNSPAAQLKGALTVGWSPVVDVAKAQAPPDSAAATHCRAVMSAAGLSTSNRVDLAGMFAACDAVYSFRAALLATQSPSVAGLRKGYEALGASFGSALNFTAFLSARQHYGVNSVRDMAYDTGCSCLIYTSKTNRS